MPPGRVCICVIGDIGHSPRMQYHSLSLADAGYCVDIVAYQESIPHEKLLSNPKIKIHKLFSVGCLEGFLPRIANYFFKVFFQSLFLFFTLLFVPRPDYIMVQNPPSVPALPIVWLICRIRQCKFVIDWHNYGHTIMAMKMSRNSPIVRLYKKIEFSIGSRSDYNFCVTNAMKNDLKKQINKDAIVLYDRPYSFFQPMKSLADKHSFFVKLQTEFFNEISPNETLFTKHSPENEIEYELKKDRPVILVSGTSWTEDEDFQLLLDALYELDSLYLESLIKNENNVKVVCFITGKGPLKQYYMDKVDKEYSFKHTKFVFPWLAAQDYPRLLACADLGICLHKSSSGLDLPMKVLDMFGSALPVCAFNYQSIDELVIADKNGILFDNTASLVQALITLLKGFPNCQKLQQMRTFTSNSFKNNGWKQNWTNHALPVFQAN